MISENADEEESFDLTEVLRHRMLSLKTNYVLILEWLFDDDEQTGLSLAEWLRQKFSAGKVEHVRCRTLSDIEMRLDRARREISTRGVPIVHFEAHGESPDQGRTSRGFIGPNGIGVRELIEWERLADMLRPLNIATKFNLLVVGAACHGEGLLLGALGGKPMPFVAVVGYTDTVSPLSLKHSLQELYRSLLLEKSELGSAAEMADNERHFPEDAVIRPTSMMVLLAESFILGTAPTIKKLRTRSSAGREQGETREMSGIGCLLPEELQMLRRSLEEAWSLMWMVKEFPENAARFAIDIGKLIQLAIEYASDPLLALTATRKEDRDHFSTASLDFNHE